LWTLRALEDAVQDHERLRARARLAVHLGEPSIHVLARHVLEPHRRKRREDLRIDDPA
jgi:phage shock protein A